MVAEGALAGCHGNWKVAGNRVEDAVGEGFVGCYSVCLVVVVWLGYGDGGAGGREQ